MDAQEIKQLKELQDAYLSVYEAKKVDQDEDGEMYESYLDEGLRSAVSSAVKRLLGGGKKEAEAPKPQSRGAELRKKYNLGPEGSDTSAKRQILDRAKLNAKEAQNQVNRGNAPQSYANKHKQHTTDI
jgi:predicted Zn-dependent protease